MDKVISYCGLICQSCAIYLASREENEQKQYEMRAEIAQQIKKYYDRECEHEDVTDCDGCRAKTGRLFCTSCEIRQCAKQKGFENCAKCNDYPCEKLEKLFTTDPGAKDRLDQIGIGL